MIQQSHGHLPPRRVVALVGALDLSTLAGATLAPSAAAASWIVSLSLSSDCLTAGGALAGTVTLNQADTAGVSVTLASDSIEVTLPPSVTIPAGGAQASFAIQAPSAFVDAVHGSARSPSTGITRADDRGPRTVCPVRRATRVAQTRTKEERYYD